MLRIQARDEQAGWPPAPPSARATAPGGSRGLWWRLAAASEARAARLPRLVRPCQSPPVTTLGATHLTAASTARRGHSRVPATRVSQRAGPTSSAQRTYQMGTHRRHSVPAPIPRQPPPLTTRRDATHGGQHRASRAPAGGGPAARRREPATDHLSAAHVRPNGNPQATFGTHAHPSPATTTDHPVRRNSRRPALTIAGTRGRRAPAGRR